MFKPTRDTTPILGVQFRTALFNRTVAQTVPMTRMTVMLSYRYVCHTSVTLALCMSKFLSVMEEMRAASFKSYKSYGQSRLIITIVGYVLIIEFIS